jgi:hypothetical protein
MKRGGGVEVDRGTETQSNGSQSGSGDQQRVYGAIRRANPRRSGRVHGNRPRYPHSRTARPESVVHPDWFLHGGYGVGSERRPIQRPETTAALAGSVWQKYINCIRRIRRKIATESKSVGLIMAARKKAKSSRRGKAKKSNRRATPTAAAKKKSIRKIPIRKKVARKKAASRRPRPAADRRRRPTKVPATATVAAEPSPAAVVVTDAQDTVRKEES